MTKSVSPSKNLAATVTDPVCGMKVIPGETKLVSLYEGRSYWFCAEACRDAFEADPRKYLDRKKNKREGWVRRFLNRMAKANQEEFGCSGPTCH